jgi:hypothetical protein
VIGGGRVRPGIAIAIASAGRSRMSRVVIGAAVLVIAATASALAQSIKMDVPAGLTLSTANEQAPKKKESKPDKGLFKGLRPGPCQTKRFSAPASSWPARGEPLVAFCRP